jgi:hypothetical protein
MTQRVHYPILTRDGVYFGFYGDEVIYVWPWARRRNFDCKWASTNLDFAPFRSLSEINEFWRGYWIACDAPQSQALACNPVPPWWMRLAERLLP